MLVVIALVLAALAAALHVYIWWLESMAWTTPAARKVFGTTQEEAEATKFLAFNQGYYNLFLAITTIAERTSPRNRNSTIATSSEPSTNARTAVPTALLTRSVRS